MKKSSKTYKITEIINEHFTDKLFTTNDVLDLANKKHKKIKFSLYSINQYNNYYTGWGFLEIVKQNGLDWYKMVSQIPTGMSTYLIREFAYELKEIQQDKLKPFLIKIRQDKIKNLKIKIDGN